MEKIRKRNGQSNDLHSELEEAKSEIKILKDIIDFMEKDEEKIYKKLQVENDTLKLQIRNLLKCDDCGNSFNDRCDLKNHILSKHVSKVFNCDSCRQECDSKEDLRRHVLNEHEKKSQKEVLLRKQNDLVSKITNQRINIFEKLYKFKQKK